MKNLIMVFSFVFSMIFASHNIYATQDWHGDMVDAKILAESHRSAMRDKQLISDNKRLEALSMKDTASAYLGVLQTDTESVIEVINSYLNLLKSHADEKDESATAHQFVSDDKFAEGLEAEGWGDWYAYWGWTTTAENYYLTAKYRYQSAQWEADASKDKWIEAFGKWQDLYNESLAIAVARGYVP